ncbi:oxidoreductase, Gfo/Idh/MocA family [Aquipluma nitroreducens]|uniref:Oxidoreductase, Gfo/Idh/MocA family n=1 Tax=Aquipluma nitroreducens TaxID=2010828 RepID=A0A5K7SFH4_9BACT|nr:Gfo/Idh/MocA family oxidoreductase [Aquipluma nitroreducens]BBE20216.1 oxidoreductase, Gfo/Idh/MocA family [Aquipluma nitroreducens]
MKNNRRDFLKITGLTGISLVGSRLFGNTAGLSSDMHESQDSGIQRFNMCGYSAPKINTVRVGFIGLGQRGPEHLKNMTKMEGVEIKALCDIRPEVVDSAKKSIEGSIHNPAIYTGNEEEWKKLCDRKDIDLVFIATPWDMHTPMAVYAMEQGKHVCLEVPAAVTIEECWQLVDTSERTHKHCMMMENCCYDFFELLTLNMARQGYFGEIVHAEGAYIHNLLNLNFNKNAYWKMWRLKENDKRNGNLYPTHGLGPVCQVMNINRGDKMDYMVSISGNDFMMSETAKELAAKDDFYKPFVNETYRGNMNTTSIRTNKGKTIMIQHDVTSPNIYSRIHKISGTKGSALKYPVPGRIANGGEDWLSEQEVKALGEKYQPEIVKKVGELAKEVGGHGGMDFLMDWRTIDCLRNGLPFDQDVYDAALWSVIAPLSEQSVAHRSSSVDIPDFTRGSWKTNKAIDILLDKGGDTKVKL